MKNLIKATLLIIGELSVCVITSFLIQKYCPDWLSFSIVAALIALAIFGMKAALDKKD